MANTPRLGRFEQRERMVVGFAFDDQCGKVILIQKKREPVNAGMIGKLNGVGGRVKQRERYETAMIREFQQETGALVGGWKHFAISEGDAWRLYFFVTCLNPREWRQIKKGKASVTDEEVITFNVTHVMRHQRRDRPELYPDLRWMIPLALAVIEGDAPAAIVRLDWRDM